jgi:hypothetical protein
MARAMGSMITVVAVFDAHMERRAVALRKPRISSRGERPIRERICRATRRWSPHFSMARAIKKPPRKRKTMWSA